MFAQTNRRWLVAQYPSGLPDEDTFSLEEAPAPEAGPGEVVVRNLWLSVDPYMRGRLSERKSYAAPVAIGEVMIGGTVGQVVASNADGLRVGEIVSTAGGWQDYALLSPKAQLQVQRVPRSLPPSTALGVAGMPGATAYFGLRHLGKPQEGETLVVSAAAGAVGSVVGQLAKLAGCRVVGIAGGPEKCRICVDEFGFDLCLDYKAEAPLAEQLADACPDGIDIYFENVGGPVLDAVAPLLKDGSRVPICGFVSQYNEAEPKAPWDVISGLGKAIESRFFTVGEWAAQMPAATRELAGLVNEGKLAYRETVVRGLERAPEALQGVLTGQNLGKQVVRIASAPL